MDLDINVLWLLFLQENCANVLDYDVQNISTKMYSFSVFNDLRACYLVKIPIAGNLWVAIVLQCRIQGAQMGSFKKK